MIELKKNLKRRFLALFVYVIYYSGALRFLNGFINRFQLTRRAGGFNHWPVLLRRKLRNVQILTYHRVNDEGDLFFPGVPIGVFARQMEYLARCCNVLALEDAVVRLRDRDVPENAVVVTFDDGYHDNYTYAFPILSRLSIEATIFLATDAIDGVTPLWHDRVFAAFRETRERNLRGYLPGNAMAVYSLENVVDKLAVQSRVLCFLRTLGENERDGWIDRLVEQLNIVEQLRRPALMLSWKEVREMHAHGIRFGSHTMSHPVLSTLSPERTRAEISGSKKIIEDQLGATVSVFAYPNGTMADFTQVTKDILRECGYHCAVTTIFGANAEDQDLYELRRGGPWEAHLPTFAVKLGWYKLFASPEIGRELHC
jgi:peptidoglycan/xylan/chitin deacetylase (PgdA/CDA1 family)